MQDLLLTVAGLITLVIGADLLIRGSVWCAITMGISPMMVGLTLVAFGTSAPELVVAITAALKSSPGLATGAALGSNIANIGLILGISAMTRPIARIAGPTPMEMRYVILAALLPLIPLLYGGAFIWPHGLLLLSILVVFTIQLGRREKRRKAEKPAEEAHQAKMVKRSNATLMIACVIAGLGGLYYGGNWLVEGAGGIARSVGMSEVAIGISVIAVGTSLPELVTSLVAASKGHPEIALGNVLGSNIFNICMVLGTTSLIHELPIAWEAEGIATVLGIFMAILLAFLLRRGIGRRSGASIFGIYLAYMIYIFINR
ncbi:MAG: calcium/sodium antiporter [Planctomycetota bacterium]|jgi:cation:H+ antiporter